MEFFKDEKNFVSGGGDGAIRFWDIQNKSQTYSLFKHKRCVRSIALRFDDELMLSGSEDMTVRLWNAKSKKQLHIFKGHTRMVISVLFSWDNKTALSGSSDSSIRIWNLERKTIQQTIVFDIIILQICLISQGNTAVAAGSNGRVSFYSFETRKIQKIQSIHNFSITCICFSNDEKIIITGTESGMIQIWVIEEMKQIFQQEYHKGQIIKIDISKCGEFFATGSLDFSVIIWNLKNMSIKKTLKFNQSINCLQYLKSSQFLSICAGDEIILCNLNSYKPEVKLKIQIFSTISISKSYKYIAYGYLCLHLFDLETNKNISKASNLISSVTCIRFSKICEFLAAGFYNGVIIIFKIPSLVELKKINVDALNIFSLDLSASSKYIAWTDLKKTLMIQSIDKEEIVFIEKSKQIYCLLFCCNDEKFFYSVDKSLQVLDKKFTKVAIINFNHMVFELFESESDKNILVSEGKSEWSVLNMLNLKKSIEYVRSEVIKEWCEIKENLRCRVYLSMPLKVNLG